MAEIEVELDDGSVAVFLSDPTDPYGFYRDLQEFSDEFLWNIFLPQQPTLAFSPTVLFGHA